MMERFFLGRQDDHYKVGLSGGTLHYVQKVQKKSKNTKI